MSEEFDLFQMPEGTPVEMQRDFEIFWRKYTGRSCIVVAGVTYQKTMKWGEGSTND